MYAAEANGLGALAHATAHPPADDLGIRIPEVLSVAVDGTWLLLDYVAPGLRSERTHELLGRCLARIHAAPTDDTSFGWVHDNWIGNLPQSNPADPSWAAFWRDARLVPQLELARSRGYFTSSRDGGDRMDDLLELLEPALSDVEVPSLLHGDLWGGNAYADTDGRPVLIDPAVYRGDGEVDLAMTELFGGFGARFYAAYDEVRPISDEYRSYRRDLYQLYYLLVHVNLFGTSYVAGSLSAAERVLSEVG